MLKVWQERRILPDSVIRPRIAELESFSSSGVYSRRSLRTERSFDDPIREMEGMMVDEYGRYEILFEYVLCSQRNKVVLFYIISDVIVELYLFPAIQVFSFLVFVCLQC